MNHRYVVSPTDTVAGEIRVPGDKSISHRALMLGAIAEGRSVVRGFLAGDDCLATLAALRALGVQIEQPEPTVVDIRGVGLHGLTSTDRALDMANSGTAMRLFAGLLAGQAFDTELVGDRSLSQRPMNRVADPLRQMGAQILTADGKPPLTIKGGAALHGIDYRLPVASAQVKSALLLAGLYAEGETRVSEPAVTRDHTERMLTQFGVSLRREPGAVALTGGQALQADDVAVPGDLSSATFFLLAACVARSGRLRIDNIGLNPTRTGVLRILELMGADIDIEELRTEAEPVGRLTVRASQLHGIEVPPELVPLAIDEFPAVFVAAALAQGETRISGAAELRHKESDRIQAMVAGLQALGVDVQEQPDGAIIRGGQLGSGRVDSHGDHRVAMAFAAGAVAATGPIEILDTANVGTSFPGFADLARSAGLKITEHAHGDG